MSQATINLHDDTRNNPEKLLTLPVHNVLKRLATLSADEIAEVLLGLNVKGDPYSPYRCPIANLLNHAARKVKYGWSYTVTPSGVRYQNDFSPESTARERTYEVPASVVEFMTAFDGWHYRLLIAYY